MSKISKLANLDIRELANEKMRGVERGRILQKM